MSPKLLAVIKREYLQQIRTKAFWISTFLIPTIGLGFVFLQVILTKSMTPKGKIAVVDLSGRLFDPLIAEQKSVIGTEASTPHDDEAKAVSGAGAADEKTDKTEKRKPTASNSSRKRMPLVEFLKTDATPETLAGVRKKLNADVQAERIKAYIVLDQKTLETGAAEWRAPSVKADIVTRESIASLLSRAATKVRLRDRGVDPALYDAARLSVDLDPHEAREVESGENGRNVGFNLAVSAIFFFLIYISIFVYGAFIMRGVLEEKNNRIVEVIISSMKPTDLMLGKILGIGLVGLTQYAVWAVLATMLSAPGVFALLGMTEAMPSIPIGTILAFVVFFLLGYFLYASMYAALAAPFNTEQEAQQFVMLPGIILVLTSTTWFFAFNSPNGALAQALSFFPFTAPLMMFMRISVQPPPAWQIALSISLLLLAIWGMAWFAGRVYRVGILMYGKKPTLPEIFRWARQAD